MPSGDEIVFDWRKWPDTPYRSTPMLRLGEDDQGMWLFAPRGTVASFAVDGPKPLPVSFLTLLPRGEHWWIATWMRDNPEVDIDLYVDIVHPPEWTDDDRLRIVDLDLDVIRRRSGDVSLDDEDEFERHAVTLGYPAEVVSMARTVADETLSAVVAGTPLFSAPPDHWLAVARAASTEAT